MPLQNGDSVSEIEIPHSGNKTALEYQARNSLSN
jgi:hypothetical protein